MNLRIYKYLDCEVLGTSDISLIAVCKGYFVHYKEFIARIKGNAVETVFHMNYDSEEPDRVVDGLKWTELSTGPLI